MGELAVMNHLFLRCFALAMRHPTALAFVAVALLTLPNVMEAQGGTGACYAAGYGSACDAGAAAGAANALTIFGILLYVTWYLIFWP